MKGWFLIDFCASFPLDVIALLVIRSGYVPDIGLEILVYFRIPRLLWSLHILEIFQNLEKNIQLSPGYIRLLKLTLAVFINTHWLGCFFFYVGSIEPADQSWLHHQSLEFSTIFSQYLHSIYWALTTMATVGYGDIIPRTNLEIIYVLFAEFIGVSTFAYIVGNIAMLVSNLDARAEAYRQKMDSVNNFLRFREIPAPLKDRVKSYYDYLWSRNKGIKEEEILSDLPSALRTEVSLYLYRDVLAKVPIFQKADKIFLNALVKILKPVVFSPGDYIIVQGEIGKEMYFISSGQVEVCSANGDQIYATLHGGDFFGEVALLFAEKRTASIRSVNFCDLFCLTRDDLEAVLKDYPEIATLMKKTAQERYKKNQ